MKKFINGKLVEMTAEEVARFKGMQEKTRNGRMQSQETDERIKKLEEKIAALLTEKAVSE